MRKAILAALVLWGAVGAMAQKQHTTTIVEKKRVVTGMEDFSSLADQDIFVNALLWAINEGPMKKDEILDCDFQKHRLALVYHLKKDEDKDSYTCRLQLQVAQGQLIFTVSEVKIQGSLLGANFDRLSPEKKPKHADIIHEFERMNDEKLQDLFKFISTHKCNITNWTNVRTGKMDRGMSEEEVRLVYGKPIAVQENGTTVQYMYSTFVYVFLESGLVKSFVN